MLNTKTVTNEIISKRAVGMGRYAADRKLASHTGKRVYCDVNTSAIRDKIDKENKKEKYKHATTQTRICDDNR